MTEESSSLPGNFPRVLQLASGDLWAGAEVQIFTLVTSLKALGVTVDVVLLNHGSLEQKLLAEGIDVLVLDETRLNSFRIFVLLIQTLKSKKPDVLHTHRFKENIIGSTAAFVAGRFPSIRTVHGAPEHCPPWTQPAKRLLPLLDRLCGRFIQRKIIAVSTDLKDIIKKDFPAQKLHVIENGIRRGDFLGQLDRCGTEPIDQHRKLFKIGIAGRLVPVKRIDKFIEIARYIHEHHPDLDVSFHIFGDGPLAVELKLLRDEFGLGQFVKFEGHCQNMAQALSSIDVLMMTSDHEGLPMILLEAMVLRVPIISHAIGGVPKLLDFGSCGVLVKTKLASDYADALYRLLNNPGTYNTLSENAYNRVSLYYSAEQNAKAYLAVYSHMSKNT